MFVLCFSLALVNGTFHFQYPCFFSFSFFFASKTVFSFVFNFPLSLETAFPFKSVAVSVKIRCSPEKYRRLLWGWPSDSVANREGSESLLFTSWFFCSLTSTATTLNSSNFLLLFFSSLTNKSNGNSGIEWFLEKKWVSKNLGQISKSRKRFWWASKSLFFGWSCFLGVSIFLKSRSPILKPGSRSLAKSRIYHSIPLVTVLISKAGHVWVSWPCEEKIGKLGVGNVLVLLNRHGYDRQEATNQWKPKPLLNKPKQELQRNLWTKVSTNITNTTAHEKLMSDNGKRRIFLKWQ